MPNEEIQSQKPFLNAGEDWMLFDTVLVGPNLTKHGWYLSYAAMGLDSNINFFNVRNRSVGLFWNNQDTRDQTPYAFELKSIGVSFWANSMSQVINGVKPLPPSKDYAIEDYVGHLFSNDLPRHCSITLQVQQDEVLKSHALFTPPGYGPFGSGYGRGQPSSGMSDEPVDTILGVNTQSMPMLSNRWLFPNKIEIPRRAAVSVKLRFSSYARALLQALPAPMAWVVQNEVPEGTENAYQPVYAGIQVSLVGKRLVQQRGQYHA